MAASEPPQRPQTRPQARGAWLSAQELLERLGEEIARAERHGTALSCLVVVIDNLHELAHEHGEELGERALEYAAGALPGELRRFDRVGRPDERELAILLPGADGPRAEVVARRVLERLGAIKVEAAGERRALVVSVGLASWREDARAEELLARARAAVAGDAEDPDEDPPYGAQGERGAQPPQGAGQGLAEGGGEPQAAPARQRGEQPRPFGRAGRS